MFNILKGQELKQDTTLLQQQILAAQKRCLLMEQKLEAKIQFLRMKNFIEDERRKSLIYEYFELKNQSEHQKTEIQDHLKDLTSICRQSPRLEYYTSLSMEKEKNSQAKSKIIPENKQKLRALHHFNLVYTNHIDKIKKRKNQQKLMNMDSRIQYGFSNQISREQRNSCRQFNK